jgi:L,D-transpeptidase ErfK/SrfK
MTVINRIIFTLVLISLLSISPAFGEFYPYSHRKTVIGFPLTYVIQKNDSLIEVARKYSVGFNEIAAANPSLDPFVPEEGISIKIPKSWILPEIEQYSGIVINLSEMRLYYFFSKKSSNLVRTFPIGIGTEGNDTPEGIFTVVEKIVDPSWYPPESIRKEDPDLPTVVPPGPDNPLGSHAMRLSRGNILIHGTNRPFGIGRRVSHGCIRLYPEDIPKLFQVVPEKSKVTIVKQPVKVGTLNNDVYIEVHRDQSLSINYFDEAVRLLRKKNIYHTIDKEKMISALRQKRGLPVNITKQRATKWGLKKIPNL